MICSQCDQMCSSSTGGCTSSFCGSACGNATSPGCLSCKQAYYNKCKNLCMNYCVANCVNG
uniref:Kazal-like domain-containing protein n=1 Tax=Setaria italica TaxID=4555 RepID=K3Y230_SETIT